MPPLFQGIFFCTKTPFKSIIMAKQLETSSHLGMHPSQLRVPLVYEGLRLVKFPLFVRSTLERSSQNKISNYFYGYKLGYRSTLFSDDHVAPWSSKLDSANWTCCLRFLLNIVSIGLQVHQVRLLRLRTTCIGDLDRTFVRLIGKISLMCILYGIASLLYCLLNWMKSFRESARVHFDLNFAVGNSMGIPLHHSFAFWNISYWEL